MATIRSAAVRFGYLCSAICLTLALSGGMADAINPQVSVADPTGPFMPVEKASVVPYAPLLAFPVIMHFFHGNYCGRGKVDETYRKPATDVVDRLCMRHDRCYGRVEATPMTRRAKKAAFCGCDAALFRRATKKRANYRSVPINLRSKVIVLQRIFGAKSKSCRP